MTGFPDAAPTSAELIRTAQILISDRFPIVVDRGDRTLLDGQLLPLPEALARLIAGLFVHLRYDVGSGCLEPVSAGPQDVTEILQGDTSLPSPFEAETRDHGGSRLVQARVPEFLAQDRVPVAIEVPLLDLLADQFDERHELKTLLEAPRLAVTAGRYRNTLIATVSDEASRVATALAHHPGYELVPALPPTVEERRWLVAQSLAQRDTPLAAGAQDEVQRELVTLTQGMDRDDVSALLAFAALRGDDRVEPRELVQLYRTGTPPTNPYLVLRDRLPEIATQLHRRVVGQPDAVEQVIEVVGNATLGYRRRGASAASRGPRAAFLFAGASGVGKTELAKAVAAHVYGNEAALVYVQGNQLQNEDATSRLVGSGPGYVGFGEGGQLTDPLLEDPFRVVLIDEFEKAHPTVFNTLMGPLEEGRTTDGRGRAVDFSDAVIIGTCNVGNAQLSDRLRVGPTPTFEEVRAILDAAVQAFFRDRADLLGRVQVVAFDILRSEAIGDMTDLFLDEMTFEQGPAVVVDRAAARQAMCRLMRDPATAVLGGRPIRDHLAGVYGQIASTVMRNSPDAGLVEVTWHQGDPTRALIRIDGGPSQFLSSTLQGPLPALSASIADSRREGVA